MGGKKKKRVEGLGGERHIAGMDLGKKDAGETGKRKSRDQQPALLKKKLIHGKRLEKSRVKIRARDHRKTFTSSENSTGGGV